MTLIVLILSGARVRDLGPTQKPHGTDGGVGAVQVVTSFALHVRSILRHRLVSKRIVGSERLIGVPNSLASQTHRSNSIRGVRDLRRAIVVFVFEA